MQDTISQNNYLSTLKAKGQKVYVCSFGDTRLGISICRFKEQAESMQVFDDIIIHTEASLPLDFKEEFDDKIYVKPNSSFIHYNSGTQRADGRFISRGFGYWVFKPKVILMALEQIKENDILIYLDIGFEFNPDKKDMLFDMLKQVDQNEIMGLISTCAERSWNKADLLNYYHLLNDEEFLDSGQCIAGMIFLKKTTKACKIINEWMDMFYTHFELIDDSPSKIPNLPEFRENRHDQSIWSILNKKYKLKNFPPDIYPAGNHFALNYNRNKIYLPNDVTEMKHFNESVRKYGFKFDEKILEAQSLKNELNSLPILKQKQELANLKLDENLKKLEIQDKELNLSFKKQDFEENVKIKKLEVKKLEKELGMKLSKLEPRVNLILSENLKSSAVARVRNHLAYRLGAAIIVCNKSFFGICSLPFVLSFIKAQYKKEQAAYQSLIKQKPEFKLPKIENYPDYKAALKEKECLTYKLGEAMIRAGKTWYKGGLMKFYVEAKRLEREFKTKRLV